MTDAPGRLIDALVDHTALLDADLLAEQVVFRSPYADYTGRADVGHLTGLIRRVVPDLRVSRRLADGSDAMSSFEATAAGHAVQGVLVERRDREGRVTEAMLTLRPYAGLRAAMGAMQSLLDTAPLPSRRSR
jgi:hypothetical protein